MKSVEVLFGVLALVFVADGGVSVTNPFYCFSTDFVQPQVQMHATLTSYEAVLRTGAVDKNISSK